MLATFTVTNLGDLQPDGMGGMEVVPGSLRDALTQANEFEDPDVIVFDENAFLFGTSLFLQDDMDQFGQLLIEQPVRILGPGPKKLTIHAAPGSRIFETDIGSNTELFNVEISGVRLIEGNVQGMNEDGQGGAIFNRENLTMIETVISGNSASNGGGGIFNDFGALNISRSLITNNSSGTNGGGIYSGSDNSNPSPTTTITNSTISGNTASTAPPIGVGTTAFGYGGGVFNRFGTMNVRHSTITGNSSYLGSGLASYGNPLKENMDDPEPPPPTVFTNIFSSIFSGNENHDEMGAVVHIDIDTVGKALDENDMETDLNNSIESEGYNIIQGLGVGVTLAMGDQIGFDPLLGNLADNGGSTDTFYLLPGSPAIDMGPSTSTSIFDQRGRHFTRKFGSKIDVGAVEVQSGNFVVDTLVDENDGQFSEVSFGPDPYIFGDFSLREAVDFSRKNPESDTIRFSTQLAFEDDPKPFTPAPTIVLTLGTLQITDVVDFVGPSFELEIDGNDAARIFDIFANVTMSNLTLLGGGGVLEGAAIRSSANLTIIDSTIKESSATLNGGGVFVDSGDLSIFGSTINDNSAFSKGGGVFIGSGAGTVTITNSTISGNTASLRGGGILNAGADTTIQYSTITLNNAAATLGSGIANDDGGQLSVGSTIISGNINNDIDFFAPATAADILSLGYNLVGTGNAVTSFNQTGDQTGVLDPLLAPLQFTGGPTPTHRILEGSPALDRGDPNAVAGIGGVPLFDQRGSQFARVFDGDISGNARIDIGAFELQSTVFTVDSALDENDGIVSLGNFSLREAVEVANAAVSPLPNLINFDPSLIGSTIVLTGGTIPGTSPDLQITQPVTIAGPGSSSLTIDGSVNGFAPLFTVDDSDSSTTIDVAINGVRLQNSLARAVDSRENLTSDRIFVSGNNGGIDHQDGVLTISNSTFTGNSTAGDGAAVLARNGTLNITSSVIAGNSTTQSLGDGAGVYAQDTTTTITGTSITGNQTPSGNADGAGIFSDGGELLLMDSVVSGNTTTGSNSEGAGIVGKNSAVTLSNTIVSQNKTFGTLSEGAGIYVYGGSLAINNSLVTQNTTAGQYSSGGGIASRGSDVSIYQSIISQNATTGDDAHGGGIYHMDGNLTVRDSTVSGNSVSGLGNLVTGGPSNGGGIYSNTDLLGATTSIVNSTISGNSSGNQGGGVFNADGLMEIKHSTITANNVPYFGQGGGVASFGNTSTRTDVQSTIIAGNLTTSDAVNPFSDVDAVDGTLTNSFQTWGYNLIGDGLALAAFNGAGDKTGITDPKLGPLTNNGGPTPTHALLEDSPAVNAGDPAFDPNDFSPPLLYDQRGASFERVLAGRIDIGAFESTFTPQLAADFNGDGIIDGLDFLIWQRGFGKGPNANKSDGDANNDGFVNSADLAEWETGFGSGTPSTVAALSSSTTSTPPPVATLALEAEEADLPSALASSSVDSKQDNLQQPLNQTSDQTPLVTGLSMSPIDVGALLPGRFAISPSLDAEVAARDESIADFVPVSELDVLLSEVVELEGSARSNRLAHDPEADPSTELNLELEIEDLIFDLLGADEA